MARPGGKRASLMNIIDATARKIRGSTDQNQTQNAPVFVAPYGAAAGAYATTLNNDDTTETSESYVGTTQDPYAGSYTEPTISPQAQAQINASTYQTLHNISESAIAQSQQSMQDQNLQFERGVAINSAAQFGGTVYETDDQGHETEIASYDDY